jgi:hypothetical protein
MSDGAAATGKGFADGSKILGWVSLDPLDRNMIKTAIYLFGNVWIGLQLPNSWVSNWPIGPAAGAAYDGFVWSGTGEATNLDHAIDAHGYDAAGLKISNWGSIGSMTWAAFEYYVGPTGVAGEAYTFITQDHIKRGQALSPTGFDWGALMAHFNSINPAVSYLARNSWNDVRQHVKRGRFWRNGRRAESF